MPRNPCKHDKSDKGYYCKECKVEGIGGKGLCEHYRARNVCKDCGGVSICEHNKQRTRCIECGGGHICEHNNQRFRCKECKKEGVGGKSLCDHNRRCSQCKYCKGASICVHNRQRHGCKECKGSSICQHNRERYICKDCQGGGICEHNRRRSMCKECDVIGYISHTIRSRIRDSIKREKSKASIEYLGCSIEEFKEHIEKQFKPDMTWENHGDVWHIDHVIPLKYDNPTIEQVIERLHWKNTQPMYASENLSKGNRRIG